MIKKAHRNDQAATTVLLAARWLKSHPNDSSVIYDYADMLYQMTRYDEAIQVYLDAIERFKDHRWILYSRLGKTCIGTVGDFATAESWYQKTIDEKPDDAGGYIFLGRRPGKAGQVVRSGANAPPGDSLHERASR